MTVRPLLLLALAACAPKREVDDSLARARARVDELARGAQGPVFDPPEVADALLPRGPALSACAPNRSDLGVLVEGGVVVAFDRALVRDATIEACLTAALPKLEGRVLFVPATLPGGKPQVLRLDAASAATMPDLDAFDPKIELAIVVARDAPPDAVTRVVEKIRDRGFEKLVLHVED
jgi:hypothetical protein